MAESLRYEYVYVVVVLRDPLEQSAISVVAPSSIVEPMLPSRLVGDKAYDAKAVKSVCHVLDLKRISHSSFEAILSEATSILDHPKLYLATKQLIIDVTTTGESVVDAVDYKETWPVLVSVDSEMGDDVETIHSRDLKAALVSAYQSQQVRISSELELATTLNEELRSVSLTSKEELSAIALSIAIGVWWVRMNHKRDEVYSTVLGKRNGERTDWDPLNYDQEGE